MNGEMRSRQEVEEGDKKLFCKHLCGGTNGGGRGWMDGWLEGWMDGRRAAFNDKQQHDQKKKLCC